MSWSCLKFGLTCESMKGAKHMLALVRQLTVVGSDSQKDAKIL
jgi:hypothetical protein